MPGTMPGKTLGSINTAMMMMANQTKFFVPLIVTLLLYTISSGMSALSLFFLSMMYKMTAIAIIPNANATILCNNVQKKGTPFKKPKNKGGSPIGVNEPPTLLTIKIKKTM